MWIAYFFNVAPVRSIHKSINSSSLVQVAPLIFHASVSYSVLPPRLCFSRLLIMNPSQFYQFLWMLVWMWMFRDQWTFQADRIYFLYFARGKSQNLFPGWAQELLRAPSAFTACVALKGLSRVSNSRLDSVECDARMLLDCMPSMRP